jgi:ABC-type branched-subunit amino acid transport system substrate-binding protein
MKKYLFIIFLVLCSCQKFTKKYHEPKLPPISSNPSSSNPSIANDQGIFLNKNLPVIKTNQKKVQVALFLPFSGKNKDLGFSLFNSATISLFYNDPNGIIELVLFDSKENPKDSEKAFKEIIDKKIKIVIGPIFSNSVEAIEKLARQHKISVISLSNNQNLINKIDKEGGVFISGILPEIQIEKIVNYAISQGKLNFAIIAPSNQYGKTITELLKKFVRSKQGNFITSEFYDNNSKDLDRVVERVIDSFILPDNLAKAKKDKDLVINDYDRIYPQVIMIPESGKIASKIISSIKKQNKEERDFQILGTSQWDDKSIFDSNLINAWFPAPENEKFSDLENFYYSKYEKFPPRLASIVYDMIGLIAEITNRKQGQTPNLSDFINFKNGDKNGYQGVDGLFRFLPNGLTQRNLAVLKITTSSKAGNWFETIEKPNDSFIEYNKN